MLKKGSVTCANIGDGAHLKDVVLEQGAHFGERAFTDSKPRAADVVANEDCECITMYGSDFKALLGGTLVDVGRPASPSLFFLLLGAGSPRRA